MIEYEVIATVGEGAHGIVFKARHSISGDIVALKKQTLKKMSTEGIPVQMIREIKALQCIEHENIVNLIDVFPQGLSFVLVFDFMPSNLWEILDNYRLNGAQVKCYMQMLLKALEYLHSNHILHRVSIYKLKSLKSLARVDNKFFI
jgi:serine/threonine protein kinase